MTAIPLNNNFWSNAVIEYFARVWAQDSVGTQQRMINSSSIIRNLADNTNLIIAMCPRTVFNKCQPIGNADHWGLWPLYYALWFDGVPNADECVISIISVPRLSGDGYTGDCYAASYSSPDQQTDFYNDSVTAVNKYTDAFKCSYGIRRGAGATDADFTEAIQTQEGFTVLAATIQDDRIVQLDTALHADYCQPDLAELDGPVLADVAEQIRSCLHNARRYNLPHVFSWSAMGTSRAAAAAPGDDFGIVVDSTSYVNVFDQSVTARTATSPGQTANRRYAATGLNVSTQCTVRAIATCSGAAGYIKFIGPDHVASNDTTITVPDGTSVAICGDDTNTFLMNANIAADDVTTACNKVDVHAKVDAGGLLTIHYLSAWEQYTI